MKYKLADIFEKPISGEWGEELREGEKGTKVIRTTNFTNLGRLDLNNIVERKIDLEKFQNKVLKLGDIIIEKSGGSPTQPVGRTVIFDVDSNEKYICNNFTAILRPINNVYPKYVLYLLKDLYNRKQVIKFQNKTTGIINLKLNDYLLNTEITLPKLEIQKKIANLLDKSQELIDKRKAQIDVLDVLVKSRFIEMFGDPVSNPMNWEKKKLSDECNIITGNTPSRKVSEYYGDYIEWIKSDNINTPNRYLTVAEEYLSEKGLQVGRSVEKNSILMTCIAGSIKCIGNVAIADRKVAFNQQINAIEPVNNNVLFMFEQFGLSQRYIQSTINMPLKGILSKGQLSELEFIFPPLDLQNQFAAFVNQVDKLKFEIENTIKVLEKSKILYVKNCFNMVIYS